jgi:CRP/FNR family transcriptional regulator, cyclic AMP receptor protein
MSGSPLGAWIDVLDTLGASEIFGAMLEDELEQLAQFGSRIRYPANKIVFEKGDPGDCLMIVLEGRVKIRNISADGREMVLDFVDPGRLFGEIALLDGKPRTAGAVTQEPSELFVLRRSPVLRYLEEKPLVAIRLIGVLCQRLRRSTQMFEEKILLDMAPRVARGLLRLATEHGHRIDEGLMIDLKLSQAEIGAFVGISRENVNRQLSAWRDGGIIKLSGGRIVIQALEDLRSLAGDDLDLV